MADQEKKTDVAVGTEVDTDVVKPDTPVKSTTTSFDESEPSELDHEGQEPTFRQKLWKFYCQNEFMILMICAICLARAYPPLGAEYLYPQYTASWLAVCAIFLLAGIGLLTSEFANAFKQLWFNVYVQVFNFGAGSAIVYAVAKGLDAGNIVSQDLINGMIITGCLPMTVNMVMVLTFQSGGDESLATIGSAVGNLMGVFLSPVLILGYVGLSADIDMGEVFWKMILRVVVPVIVGQIIQHLVPVAYSYYKKHEKNFKSFGEYSLIYIVYCVFCISFNSDRASAPLGDIFLMIIFLFITLITIMIVAWISLAFLFPNRPESRVMGLFGCSHKTIALGIPMIDAIYGDDPAVGIYTLPILIWHPMQLFVGTFLKEHLKAWVARENIRLGKTPQVLITSELPEYNKNLEVDVEQAEDNAAGTEPPLPAEELLDVPLETKDDNNLSHRHGHSAV